MRSHIFLLSHISHHPFFTSSPSPPHPSSTPQNQECCGEFILTRDTTIAPLTAGATTKADATSSGTVSLPDRPNLTEVCGAQWNGHPRSFYLSFDNPADQKQFIKVVESNVKQLGEGVWW